MISISINLSNNIIKNMPEVSKFKQENSLEDRKNETTKIMKKYAKRTNLPPLEPVEDPEAEFKEFG